MLDLGTKICGNDLTTIGYGIKVGVEAIGHAATDSRSKNDFNYYKSKREILIKMELQFKRARVYVWLDMGRPTPYHILNVKIRPTKRHSSTLIH